MQALVRQTLIWGVEQYIVSFTKAKQTMAIVKSKSGGQNYRRSLLRGAQCLSQSPASPQGANTAQNHVGSRYGLNFPMKLCFLTSAQTVLSQTPGRLFVKIYHSWGHCLWQSLHICAGDVRGWRWGPCGTDWVIVIEGQCK